MPLYDYSCRAESCGITFEALVLSQDDRDSVCCPRCESRSIEQLPTTFTTRMSASSSAALDIKRGPCHNPFENLTLHHIHDEQGKPVKVNSRRELEAAEKRYGFVHALSHSLTMEQLDTPPQHEKWAGDLVAASNYQWRWARDPVERQRMMESRVVTTSVGIAGSRAETLAGASASVASASASGD